MAYFEQVNGVAADYLLGGGGMPVLTQNVKAAVDLESVCKELKKYLV